MGGNRARLDPRRLCWPRCISDVAPHRQLRRIISGLDAEATLETIPREETFVTPAQSELAALLCMATSEDDLFSRLERLIVGWRGACEPIFAPAVLPVEALRALLPADAINPQWINETLPGGIVTVPRFQHGGTSEMPFGSVQAVRAAQRLGGAIAVVGGGIPGVRNWFDVFAPACNLETSALIIRASVESIRNFGAAVAGTDGTDEWMSGINAVQNRVTLLDRFSLPPVIAVEAARGEYAAADAAVHVLESYGLRAIALERAGADDSHPPEVAALAAMTREWIHMQALPHPFIMAGRAARDQAVDIVSNIYGAVCEWSAAAEAQMKRIEQAGGSEAAVVVEAENQWDTWTSSHALYGFSSPNAIITQVEWRASAGYIKVSMRKVS
jgi:formate--tetrahydrofolate ligase